MGKSHRGGREYTERSKGMAMMTQEPLWELTTAYETSLAKFAPHDHVKRPWIACVTFSKDTLEEAYPNEAEFIPLAFTVGGVIPLWLEKLPLIGKYRDYLNRPIGMIAVRSDLQQSFTAAERKFIVAHEYSHIVKNHWPMAQLGPVIGNIVEDIIAGLNNSNFKIALTKVFPSVRKFLGVRFNRQSEIDSDMHAVKLVKSKLVAERTIRKLAGIVADDNLDVPTHYAIVDGAYVGVLTFRDRLNYISASP